VLIENRILEQALALAEFSLSQCSCRLVFCVYFFLLSSYPPKLNRMHWFIGQISVLLARKWGIKTRIYVLDCANFLNSDVNFQETEVGPRAWNRRPDWIQVATCRLKINKNIATAIRSWSAAFLTLASYHRRCSVATVDMIVNNRLWRSHSVFSSWQHLRCDDGRALLTTAAVWRHVEQEVVLMFEHISVWTQNISQGRLGKDRSAATESVVPIVFHSNCGSILFSFQDMITGRTTDRRMTDGRTLASIKAGQQ